MIVKYYLPIPVKFIFLRVLCVLRGEISFLSCKYLILQ